MNNSLVTNFIDALNRHMKSFPVLITSVLFLIIVGKVVMFVVISVTDVFIYPLILSFLLAMTVPRFLIFLEEAVRYQSIKNDKKKIANYINKHVALNSYIEEDIEQTKAQNIKVKQKLNQQKDKKMQTEMQISQQHKEMVKKASKDQSKPSQGI